MMIPNRVEVDRHAMNCIEGCEKDNDSPIDSYINVGGNGLNIRHRHVFQYFALTEKPMNHIIKGGFKGA